MRHAYSLLRVMPSRRLWWYWTLVFFYQSICYKNVTYCLNRNILDCNTGCLFVQVYFPTPVLQVKFLCSVIAYPGAKHGPSGWPELRLRCLRLVASLLRQSDDSISWALHLEEPVVPALLIAAATPLAPIRHTALDCLFILASSIGAGLDSNTYMQLLEAVKDRREEIMLDAEYVYFVWVYRGNSRSGGNLLFSLSYERYTGTNILSFFFLHNHITSPHICCFGP